MIRARTSRWIASSRPFVVQQQLKRVYVETMQGAQSDSDFVYGTTLYNGILNAVNQSGQATPVSFLGGIDITGAPLTSTSIAEAVTAAEQAGVVILAVGEPAYAEVIDC